MEGLQLPCWDSMPPTTSNSSCTRKRVSMLILLTTWWVQISKSLNVSIDPPKMLTALPNTTSLPGVNPINGLWWLDVDYAIITTST